MILPSDDNDRPAREEPAGEEETLLALRRNFFELRDAQSQFEALWYSTGRGEFLPGEESLDRVLGAITGQVELIGRAFGSLRVLREGGRGEDHRHPDSSEPERPR